MRPQFVHAICRTKVESGGKPIMWNELFKKPSRAPGASRGADDRMIPPGQPQNQCPTLKRMEKTVQAVYENGVLRPLEPIPLEDRQEVTVTISDEGNIPRDHPLLASPDEWADAARDPISLDQVRRALATIRGSVSDAVIEQRRDR